ncbi:hypothetical protein ACFLRO_01310 [Bacteroidota bacterium]
MTGLFLAGCASEPERVTVQAPVAAVNNESFLSDKTINAFLKAMIQIEEIDLPEDFEYAFDLRAFDDDGTFKPFSANIGIFQGTAVQDEVRKILEEADLGDAEQFTAIGDRIYRAYAALQAEEEAKAVLEAGQEAESEAGRQEAIDSAADLLVSANLAPEEDKVAVRTYVGRMREILEH